MWTREEMLRAWLSEVKQEADGLAPEPVESLKAFAKKYKLVKVAVASGEGWKTKTSDEGWFFVLVDLDNDGYVFIGRPDLMLDENNGWATDDILEKSDMRIIKKLEKELGK